jgi:hypothetical protein
MSCAGSRSGPVWSVCIGRDDPKWPRASATSATSRVARGAVGGAQAPAEKPKPPLDNLSAQDLDPPQRLVHYLSLVSTY